MSSADPDLGRRDPGGGIDPGPVEDPGGPRRELPGRLEQLAPLPRPHPTDFAARRSAERAFMAQSTRATLLADVLGIVSDPGPSLTSALQEAAARIARVLECSVILRIADAQGDLLPAAAKGVGFDEGDELAAAVDTLLHQRTTPAIRALRAGMRIVANPISGGVEGLDGVDDRLVAGLRSVPVNNLYFAPIVADSGSLLGSFGIVRHGDDKPFASAELALADGLVQLLALAVRAARAEDVLQARAREIADTRGELERTVHLLAASNTARQALLTRLIRAQEDERSRIAGEIHDDSIQVLSALGLRLQLLRRHLDDPASLELTETAETVLSQAIDRLRRLLFELRPPDLEVRGLVSALNELASQHFADRGVRWHSTDRMGQEPPEAERAIVYRIAREALANVAKHALPTSVELTLEQRSGGLLVRIEDDGTGFDPAGAGRVGHLGLTTMREQAELAGGRLQISSREGTGTTVEAWIPIGRTGDGSGPAEPWAGPRDRPPHYDEWR